MTGWRIFGVLWWGGWAVFVAIVLVIMARGWASTDRIAIDDVHGGPGQTKAISCVDILASVLIVERVSETRILATCVHSDGSDPGNLDVPMPGRAL